MSKRNTLFKIGGVVSTALLGVAICGTKIGLDNKGAITNFMGQSDFKIVNEGGEGVDTEYYKSNFTNLNDLIKAGGQLGEKIEGEGAVLLKNNNKALPLAKNSKVSLVGISAIDPAYGGRGSAQASNPLPPVTPKEGFENAGFNVNTSLLDWYDVNKKEFTRGRNKINDASWERLTKDGMVQSIIDQGGTAVYTISRVGGEGGDFAKTGSDGKDGDYLKLSANEESVILGLKELKAQGKIDKVVLLVNSANPIQTTYLNDEFGLDAALWIGSVGMTGMNAVAKILNGDINPSGHLSDMYWYDHDENPVSKNFNAFEYLNADDYDLPRESNGALNKKYSTYNVYQEGMYLGYRYAETRYSDVVTGKGNAGDFKYDSLISHPFGFGDSYTTFEYSNYKAKENGDKYTITLDVKNTGDVAGKDVVQAYVQKPYNDKAKERNIEVPAVELVGFAKTNVIEPGKTEKVTIEVDKKEFTVYDSEIANTYIINDGEYYLTAATDSHNAINNILAAQGYADKVNNQGSANFAKKFTLSYDDTTYAVSKATGKAITNLFDDADINKYYGKEDNNVTYVSRKDWTGTLPTTNVKLSMTADIEYDLLAQDDMTAVYEAAKDSTREMPTYGKAAGLQLVNMIKDEQGNLIPYEADIWNKFLDQLSWDDIVTLVGSGLRKTATLPSIGKPGTLDHNGPAGLTEAYKTDPDGLAAKTNDPDGDKKPPYYPCAGIIAATFNKDLAKEFGNMLGEDALWAGYNGLYGIAINTHRSAYEGRAYEYFSEDPFLAGVMATEETKALQAKGCNAYIKHFALNEQETQRNGVQIWLNEQTLRQIYLKPFEMCVVDGGAMNAMASFTRIGTQYNPACKALLTDFLRGELGMKGLVVTDMFSIGYKDYHMPTFIMAGCDIPDGDGITAIYDQFKEGYADLHWAMRESAKHVLYATAHSNAMNGFSTSTKVYKVTPGWIKTVYAVDATLAVLWVGVIGAAIFFNARDRKAKKEQE